MQNWGQTRMSPKKCRAAYSFELAYDCRKRIANQKKREITRMEAALPMTWAAHRSKSSPLKMPNPCRLNRSASKRMSRIRFPVQGRQSAPLNGTKTVVWYRNPDRKRTKLLPGQLTLRQLKLEEGWPRPFAHMKPSPAGRKKEIRSQWRSRLDGDRVRTPIRFCFVWCR